MNHYKLKFRSQSLMMT